MGSYSRACVSCLSGGHIASGERLERRCRRTNGCRGDHLSRERCAPQTKLERASVEIPISVWTAGKLACEAVTEGAVRVRGDPIM